MAETAPPTVRACSAVGAGIPAPDSALTSMRARAPYRLAALAPSTFGSPRERALQARSFPRWSLGAREVEVGKRVAAPCHASSLAFACNPDGDRNRSPAVPASLASYAVMAARRSHSARRLGPRP